MTLSWLGIIFLNRLYLDWKILIPINRISQGCLDLVITTDKRKLEKISNDTGCIDYVQKCK